MQAPDFTLTAGPSAASPRVLAALGSPIVFDYDPVFLDRFRALERRLAELLGTAGDVVLMQGEAVLGLEAAARGLVRPGLRCLNLVSGVYAKWFGDWLRAFGGDVTELAVPYDEALDPGAVERAMDASPDMELVALVHSETPSGIENPLEPIAGIAKARGAMVLADVVSAFGGTMVRVDDWGLDLCVAGPQKCLAGPPGMSIVSVSDRAWDAMRANPQAPRGSFLSLLDWKERWIDGGRTAFPYTPSVADVHGVDAAVGEVLDSGGLTASIARHALAARATRAGVTAMGLELWARDEGAAANCVTAVRRPEGVAVGDVIAHVRERYGVMLSAGYGELADRLLRLGHMGPAARSLYPAVAVGALGRGLADLGVPVRIGDGLEAVLDVLSVGADAAAAPA